MVVERMAFTREDIVHPTHGVIPTGVAVRARLVRGSVDQFECELELPTDTVRFTATRAQLDLL